MADILARAGTHHSRKAECHGLRQRSWKLATFVTMDHIHAKYRPKWIEIASGITRTFEAIKTFGAIETFETTKTFEIIESGREAICVS
jgi:hypothetical protein